MSYIMPKWSEEILIEFFFSRYVNPFLHLPISAKTLYSLISHNQKLYSVGNPIM